MATSSFPASLVAAREAVESANQNFYASVVTASFDATAAEDAEMGLTSTKEHFSKLKFNFVEMETKQGFMQQLAHDQENKLPTSTQMQSFEKEVKVSKTALKDVKNANDELRAQLTRTAEAVSEAHTDLIKSSQQLSLLIPLVEETAKQAEGLICNNPAPLLFNGQEICLSNVDVICDAQSAKLIELRRQEAALQKSLQEAREATDSETRQLPSLRRECQESDHHRDTVCASSSSGQAELREATTWYKTVSTACSLFSGLSIISMSWPTLIIDLRLTEAYQISMSLGFSPSSGVLTDAKMVSTPFQAVNLDDIIAHAVSTNDIQLLIRETKARFMNVLKTKKEVDFLSSRYTINWLPGMHTVTLAVMRGRTAVHIDLVLDANYPQFGSTARLERVDSSFTMSREEILAHIASQPQTLSQWIPILVSLCSH